MTDCRACYHYPAHDDGYLCVRCTDDYHANLAGLPWLLTELETELVRQTRKGPSGNHTSHHHHDNQPLPYSEAASQLLTDLRWWAATTIGLLNPNTTPPNDWPHLHDALAATEPHLPKHPEAGQPVRTLTDLRTKALHLIGNPPERVVIGTCDCGQEMRPVRGRRLWHCPGCHAEWDVAEVIAWRNQQAADQLLTATDAAHLAGIKPARLRKWVQRGQLAQGGTDRQGRHLYRFGDVLRLATPR